MQTVTTTHFSVLVDNILGEKFKPSRGIRQGDPLSPYIFIISMESLAHKLQLESQKMRNLIRIKLKPRGITLPFLNFADDTLILAKATKRSLSLILTIIEDFSRLSGPKINLQKSSI